jgi:hypothetical protein
MKRLLLMMGITGLVIGASYLSSGGARAVPDDTTKTGQACNVCHTADMPQLSDVGKAYEAIPTHRTDPAGAWAQLTAATGTPAAAPTPGALPPTGRGNDPGTSPSQLLWLTAGLGGVFLASSVALFWRSRQRTDRT